jgi:hypothetical protein
LFNQEDIARQRLLNQGVVGEPFENPIDVVRHLGAVQSQDFAAAKWALGLRLRETDGAAIERAFNDGAILRTHVLRPTWHFVAPEDIRWMLQLTSQRIIAGNTSYYRKSGLNQALFVQSNRVMARELQGGKHLTRTALVTALKEAGIETDNLGYVHLLLRAELDSVICSGPRRGKQFTYALLEERVPPGRRFDRDQALAELCHRYFTSHGPATPHDFAWWSGLTVNDARRGIEMLQSQLAHDEFDGTSYWFGADSPPLAPPSRSAVLVPIYDESIVAYRDRSAYLQRLASSGQALPENVVFNHTIIVDGQIVGTWKRTSRSDAVTVEMNLFTPLSPTEEADVEAAVERYARFVELPVVSP